VPILHCFHSISHHDPANFVCVCSGTRLQRSERIGRLPDWYIGYTSRPSGPHPKCEFKAKLQDFRILTMQSCIFILAICYTTILHVPQAPLGAPTLRKYLVIAGLGVTVSVMTSYQSMFYLTLSEFISVRCMDPFATALLCRIFLGERFTRTQICCCCKSH
jgi:uncharacterized membrane protein